MSVDGDVAAERSLLALSLLGDEQVFREIIDALPAAVYTTDAQGRLTHFNPACVAFSGRAPELGTDSWCVTWKLFHTDGRPMRHDECPMAIALKEGRVIRGAEAVAERPDGSRVVFEAYPTPLRNAAGELVGGVNMLVDITERKRTEIALRRITDFDEAVMSNMGEGLFTIDVDGVVTSMNPAAEKLLGWTFAELRGRVMREVLHPCRPDGSPRTAEECAGSRAMSDRTPLRDQVTSFLRKDGTCFDVEYSSSPLYEGDEVAGLVVVFRDITERMNAERALRESEERYRSLIGLAPVAVYTCEARTGALTFFNSHAVELWGRAPEPGDTDERFCGSHRLWLPDGSPLPHDQTPMAIAMRENRSFRNAEVVIERPDGTRITVLVNIDPIRDADGRVVGAINVFSDTTSLKQAERAKARLAAIIESSDDAIISKDLNGIIESWNAGAERIFGYTAEEAIGKPVTMLMPPERHNEGPGILGRIRRGERVEHYETIRRRKDGTLLDISLTVSPIIDLTGRVVGASKIARDITERKKIEAERRQRGKELERALAKRTEEVTRAQQALATTQRMAAVGTFASGLAHDMNNILMPLGTRLDMLLTHMSVDGATHDHLIAVQGLLNHLREMASNLALFARDPEQEGMLGRTEFGEWRARVWRFMEASLRGSGGGSGGGSAMGMKSIRLDFDMPADLPPVTIAPHRLTQAVLNLLHNGRDAIVARLQSKQNGERGRITIDARLKTDYCVRGAGENGGARRLPAAVVLSVTDNGAGMDEETRRRCIEPFFTTKTPAGGVAGGGGSGLGLALVYSIVEGVGGSIEIESTIGKGTTVALVLPVAPAPADAAPGETGAETTRMV